MLCAGKWNAMEVQRREQTDNSNNEVIFKMQKSVFTNYDELPLFLNAQLVAQTLGIGRASAYELMAEKNFPAIRIGSRIVVPKDKFRQWVEQQTGGEH